MTAVELAKKLASIGIFDSTKSAKTMIKHFTSKMEKVDPNNLTSAQALEVMIKVGLTDYEQMLEIIVAPIISENEELKKENKRLQDDFNTAKGALDVAQSEVQEGRNSKAELEAIKKGILNLLSSTSVPAPQISNKDESAKRKSDDAKAQNIITMLTQEEREWYDNVLKKLKDAKCSWGVLRSVYKKMHEVYSANIEGAKQAFLAEYPLDLYGPMYCKSLTAIAHYQDMRETFDIVFPDILNEYVQRKANRAQDQTQQD